MRELEMERISRPSHHDPREDRVRELITDLLEVIEQAFPDNSLP